VGTMKYSRFILYNVVGALAWTGLFIFGGYYFGNIPAVKDNFEIVIIVIIILSITPIFIEFVRGKFKKEEKD
jgi:membrane-associated protein